jgi:tetratricopeptide (TPR) repeat protein
MLYLQAGRAGDAVPHFRNSLKLNPDSAPTHYNLGIALSMLRRLEEALGEFRTAVRLDPNHAEAHNNLGAMLHVAGRLDEAEAAYRRAAAIGPNAEAHNNLGRILSVTGRDAQAVAEFRTALAQRPDLLSALSGLAWILATSREDAVRNPPEALRLADRAVAIAGGPDATALDALAAAYASSGNFIRAAETARLAIAAANRTGSAALAKDIGSRLALYERGQSYQR